MKYILMEVACNMSNPMTKTKNVIKWMRNEDVISQYEYVVIMEAIREDLHGVDPAWGRK